MEWLKKELEQQGYAINNIEVAPNSFSSSVYIVTLESEEKLVVKMSSNPKKLYTEANYLEYLSDYVKVPRIIIKTEKFIVISFEKGVNYKDEQVDELTNEQIYNIGSSLAKIHSAPVNESDKWRERLDDKIEESYQTLTEVLDKKFIDKIYNYLVGNVKNLVYEPAVLHMDYRIGNILFDDNDLIIFDFESVKIGDPYFDFVKLNRLLKGEKFKIMLDGYSGVKNLNENFQLNLNFYNIYEAFGALNWCIERGRLDSDFYNENLRVLEDFIELNES